MRLALPSAARVEGFVLPAVVVGKIEAHFASLHSPAFSAVWARKHEIDVLPLPCTLHSPCCRVFGRAVRRLHSPSGSSPRGRWGGGASEAGLPGAALRNWTGRPRTPSPGGRSRAGADPAVARKGEGLPSWRPRVSLHRYPGGYPGRSRLPNASRLPQRGRPGAHMGTPPPRQDVGRVLACPLGRVQT